MAEMVRVQASIPRLLALLADGIERDPARAIIELICNAQDACSRRRWVDPGVELRVEVMVDPRRGTLTVRDNGVGMSLEVLRDQALPPGTGLSIGLDPPPGGPGLIGTFGVGLSRIWAVASRMELLSQPLEGGTGVQAVSTDGERFVLQEVELDEPGTSLCLQLRERHQELLWSGRLPLLLAPRCACLPFPIYLPQLLNPRRLPWEEESSGVQALEEWLQAEHAGATVLARIPLDGEPDLQLSGALWVAEQAPPRLLVRCGLRLLDFPQDLLPDWATFIGAVLCCNTLSLYSSGRPRKDTLYESLQRYVEECLAVGLATLAESQPLAWKAVVAQHHAALVKASLHDDQLKAVLADQLPMPTSAGPMRLDQLVDPGEELMISPEPGPPGAALSALYAGLPVVDGTDPEVARLVEELAEERGSPLVWLGGHQSEPALVPMALLDPRSRQRLLDLLDEDDWSTQPARFQPPELSVLRMAPDRLAVNLDCPLVGQMLRAPLARAERVARLMKAVGRLMGPESARASRALHQEMEALLGEE